MRERTCLDCMDEKSNGIIAMNISFLKIIGILGFYTAEQLKNLRDNVKEKNF